MFKNLKRINLLLTKKERKKLYGLSVLNIFSGFMDMFGVASIAPFLAVVSNEKIMNENKYVLKIKETFELSNQEIIIYFALFSMFLLILNQSTRLLNGWYQTHCTQKIFLSFYLKTFKFFVDQPYSYHIQTNSNEILEKLSMRVNAAVAGVITPVFRIMGYLFTCIFLFILLVIANPTVTLLLLAFTGLFYFIVFSKLKIKIENYGKFAPEYSRKTYKLVDQSLRSIKDIKMKNNASFYKKLIESLANKFADNQINKDFFGLFPRSLLEVLAYIFAFSTAIYFVTFSSDFSTSFILLGIYAFSLQKILPAAQGIYHQLTEIKFYKPSLETIYDELLKATKLSQTTSNSNSINNFNFSNSIQIHNVKFQYRTSDKKVLDIKQIDLKATNFIGITGKTGSGKTTFIDLILGLLDPSSGKILIDGKELDKNLGDNWRSKIGYVPQFSFMADDTITNNIALGQTESEINLEKIKKVSQIANISDFIENDLPNKYETVIGENGVRLSGGQIQRLSIARSLYKDPEIIVLDEATNSLDALTEKNIVESLLKNYKNKTIIMIAHRLSVLKKCDKILLFNKGEIVDAGTYDFLVKNNLIFRDMLNIN